MHESAPQNRFLCAAGGAGKTAMRTILEQHEVARLIESAGKLMHRTMMMMLYATGLRRAERCHLKVSDIDSQRTLTSFYILCIGQALASLV